MASEGAPEGLPQCSGWSMSGAAGGWEVGGQGFPRGFRMGVGRVSAGFPGGSGGFRMCLHFECKHACYVWPRRRGVKLHCKNQMKRCRREGPVLFFGVSCGAVFEL